MKTPLSTKALGQKLLKLLLRMEPLCTSSRLTPAVVEETMRQGLSVPRVLITLPLAAFHNKPRDMAAVVPLLSPATPHEQRTNEKLMSRAKRLYLARQTAIAFRHLQKTRRPGLARPISWPRRRPGGGRGWCRSTCHLPPSAESVAVSSKTNTRRDAVCCVATKPACCSLRH